MKEIKEKIADLRAREAAKKKRFDELTAKSEALKTQLKTLGKELSDISGEIRKLETQRLIETLEQNGIGVSEVENAIAAGLFGTEEAAAPIAVVTETRSDSENDLPDEASDRDTYITKNEEED